MKYFVYISEQAKEDANRLGLINSTARLKDKLELQQSTRGLERRPQPFLVKKMGRMGRLVIEERIFEKISVLCFLRLLVRGDSDYDNFYNDPEKFLQQNTKSNKVLRTYYEKRIEEDDITQSIPELSKFEYEYLFSLSANKYHEDGLIFESQEWVAQTDNSSTMKFLSTYWRLVSRMIEQDVQPGINLLSHEHDPQFAILFLHFPNTKKWFLISPVSPDDPDVIETLMAKYQVLAKSEIDEELLTRMSRRSYPALLALDSKIWIEKTQSSSFANLAMSGEEIRVLESVIEPQEVPLAYPLFINGRPGSGKSTLLHYLFAEHFHQYMIKIRQSIGTVTNPPLFLTYSENLLQHAKSSIYDILKSGSRMAIDTEEYLQTQVFKECFEQSFGYFRDFLYQLIPKQEHSDLQQSNYIDFPRFRNFWNKKFARLHDSELKSISPELAWHVIRTFIKGMSQDANDYLDPDAYDELPRRQKTVSREVFEAIYNKVWNPWYRKLCESEGHWDDQDLTRRLLDADIDLAKHLAVFCDEAQDFTSIELELMWRLSLYSHRVIPQQYLHLVPIAFAGDPFQTLNPTGFDWDSTKARFYENIVEQIDRRRSKSLQFNFQELTYNYRSTIHIVNLCNLIQLIRGVIFGIKNLFPQQTWMLETDTPPECFSASDPIFSKHLRAHPELTIIVPCQEGDEKEYIQADKFLSEIALDSQGNWQRSVHSPIRVKGLEFSRIVLYNFGNECLQHYPQLLKYIDPNISQTVESISQEAALPLEYFVNRLYVAASRAKKRLIIADTREGIEFWQLLSNESLFKKLVNQYGGDESWTHIEPASIVPGSKEIGDDDSDDPSDLADKYLEWGQTSRDIKLIEDARRNYLLANQPEDAEMCDAIIAEIKEDWKIAGDIFAKHRKYMRAIACYWEGELFSSVANLPRNDSDVSNSIEYKAAHFINSRDRNKEICLSLLVAIDASLANWKSKKRIINQPKSWAKIIQTAVEILANLPGTQKENLTSWESKNAYDHLNNLRSEGVLVPDSLELAYIAFLANRLHDCASIWEKSTKTSADPPEWVVQTYAQIKEYPNNISWVYRLSDWLTIYDHYNQNKRIKLNQEQQEMVFKALQEQGDSNELVEFVEAYPDRIRYAELLVNLINTSKERLINQVQDLLIRYLVVEAEWDTLADFIVNASLSLGTPPLEKTLLEYFGKNNLASQVSLTKSLARAENIVTNEPISNHLSMIFRINRRRLSIELSVEEAGRAIERVGLVVQALAFYEDVMRLGWRYEKNEEQFARERWLKCKYRQAEVTRDIERKDEILREAKQSEKKWHINPNLIDKIPDYPKLNIESNTVDQLAKLFREGRITIDDLIKKYQVGEITQDEFQRILKRN